MATQRRSAPHSAKKTPQPAPPLSAPRPRWRMVPHTDGVSLVPERVTPRSRREREQAVADMYGSAPLHPTGERLLPISSVLAEVLSRLNVQEADLAPELLARAWRQAAGEFLATQAQLVSLSDGIAGVHTSHPAVRFELLRNQKHIIQALNAALGEGCVQRLSVHHG